YQSLATAEQAIAQRIFLSLCDLGDGATVTRRSTSLLELVTTAMPRAVVLATLEKLLAARLVVAQNYGLGSGLEAEPAAITVPGWSSALTESTSRPTEPSCALPLPSGFLPSLTPTVPGHHQPPAASGPVLSSPTGAASEPCFDIAHEALIRNWPLLQQWLQSQGPTVRQQRAIEAAAQEWHGQRQPNHADYFLPQTRLNEAKGFRQAHGDQLSVLAHGYLEACDRYAKRSCRQRHLVRLLIPLSMATGMLTAYGHSYITQPGAKLALAKASHAPASDIRPSFTLAEAAPSKGTEESATAESAAPSSSSTALGSPQAGVVRTDVLAIASTLASPPPTPQLQAAPQLQASLRRSAHGLASSHHPASTTQTASLPTANQVVKLQAWWVSPSDPSVVMQIWCTSDDEAEPVCFTSTAARDN
ncbi:hypothetical protein C8255_16170, partial [filamentous cyanobacterium CCP3]